MPDLSKEEISQLKAELLLIKAAINEQLAANSESSDTVVLDQTAIGRVSRIDAIQQQKMAQSTRQQAKTRLLSINRALAHIEAGDYGYCMNCDASIAVARLHAKPESTLCLKCQQQADNRQNY